MKQQILKITLFLFISVLFTNCEKDNINQENSIIPEAIEKGYTVKKVTLNEVKQSSLIKNSIEKIESQLDFNKVNTSKLSKNKNHTNSTTSAIASNDPIKNKDNTFTILTDEILQVSTDSTEVYTFRIETPTEPESDFENFVIHKRSDNTVDYYLYKYKINQEDSDTYYLSREEVSSDQINLGDFDNYINSYYYYYDGCLVDITCGGGCVEVLWCDGDSGGGGGDGSTGGTSGLWGELNNSNTDPNYDPLHDSSGGGGSGVSPQPNDTNNNEGSVVGVLPPPPPTPLEAATNSFFDNLTDEQEDCITPSFWEPQNTLKKDITQFFKDNQTIRPFGYDGPVIDTDITDFANAAIDAICAGEIENFDDIIVFDGPDTPITDISDFLRCFDTSQNATVTIYVTEPNPGSGDTHSGRYVGHTFVSITQGANASTFGYYPVSDWISPLNKSGNSVLGNDGSGNEPFTASLSITVSGIQLQQIIDHSINNNPTYHLDTYNCSDFAIDIGNLAGMSLPEANGTWPGGSGSNPGTLGVEIRTRTLSPGETRDTTGGNAPATNQGC